MLIIVLVRHWIMNKNDSIFVTGYKGLVESALVWELSKQGYHNLITMHCSELDLMNQRDVEDFFWSGSNWSCFSCCC